MSFNVGMKFAGDRYPAVDPLSVQWDSRGRLCLAGRRRQVRQGARSASCSAIRTSFSSRPISRMATPSSPRACSASARAAAVRVAGEVASSSGAATAMNVSEMHEQAGFRQADLYRALRPPADPGAGLQHADRSSPALPPMSASRCANCRMSTGPVVTVRTTFDGASPQTIDQRADRR